MLAITDPGARQTTILLLTSWSITLAAASTSGTPLDFASAFASPSSSHPLGCDALGRDLLLRVIHGAQVSALVGLSAVGASLVFGSAVGLAAGWRGGWIDESLMRSVDVLLAFPGILLAVAAAAVLGPSPQNTAIALFLIGWTGYARLVRGETLALRERLHVEAARALGGGSFRIAVHHLLPMLAAPLLVQATFGLAGAIAAEASLSFLGLGVAPPTPSWGVMLAEGRAFLLTAPHLTLVPAGAIFATVLGIHLLGERLRRNLAGEHRGVLQDWQVGQKKLERPP